MIHERTMLRLCWALCGVCLSVAVVMAQEAPKEKASPKANGQETKEDSSDGKDTKTSTEATKEKDEGKETAKEDKEEEEKPPWPPNFAELLHLQPHPTEEPWVPTTAGPFNAFTAYITEKGHLYLQPYFFYSWTRGEFDKHGDFKHLPKGDMWQTATGTFFLQYGLLDNVEVDALFSIYHNRARVEGKRASSAGFGDTFLMGRYNLLHETTSWAPELSLLGQIKLPTGKYEDADPLDLETDIMGTGSTDLTLGLDLSKSMKPFVVHADLWYSWPLETHVDGVRTRYGDYINWNLGVEIPFFKERFAYMFEFSGVHQANTHEDGVEVGGSRVNDIQFGTGLEFIYNDNLQFLMGYQRTLWGQNADANDTLGVTMILCF